MRKASLPFPKSQNNPVVAIPERKAFPEDIRHDAELSRIAAQVWQTLCRLRIKTHNVYNQVWPTLTTVAAECRTHVRTVQRGLSELERRGWVGTPFGAQGGPRSGTIYHLHPGGICCDRCREAQALKQRNTPNAARGDKISPLKPPGRVTKKTLTGDKSCSAYKEQGSYKEKKKVRPPVDQSLSQKDPNCLAFWVEYTATTGVPVNKIDQGRTEQEWERLLFAERIAAVRFLPQLADGRPPGRYPLPQNYLANRIWTRAPIVKDRPERRGLNAEEIE